MSDLRHLLDLAAGEDPPIVPMSAIRRRAAALTRRRRIAAGAVAAAVLVLAAIAAPRLTAGPPPPAKNIQPRQVTVGKLAAGRQTAQVMGQQLNFTVPTQPPWTAAIVTPSRLLLTSPSTRAEVEVLPWTAIHTFTSDGVPRKTTSPPPGDLTAWLTQRPGILTLEAAVTTTLAGQPAHKLRIAVRDDYLPVYDPAHPATLGCSLPADCIMLAETPDHPIILYAGTTMTLVIQDTPSKDRLIAVAPSPNEAPLAESSADTVINSFSAAK